MTIPTKSGSARLTRPKPCVATKAVVEGVKEGMGRDNKAVDINRASREDPLNLPGITEHEVDRIIAARPFNHAHNLVDRHIVSKTEYDRIRDRVIAVH